MERNTIIVRLGPSRLAAYAGALGGCATMALVAATPLPAIVQAPLVGTLALATFFHLRIHAFRRSPASVRSFMLAPDGAIDVELAAGWREGRLRGASFVAPFLTIVRWRAAGSRFDRRIVVLPDMLPSESFRALRVLLRWSPTLATPGTDT
jgi:hypothetical protein